MTTAQSFVHILLFRCRNCFKPVASAIATGERNPDEADGFSFALNCVCGWSASEMGVSAKRHWVEEWE